MNKEKREEQRRERLGEVNFNKQGTKMKIIKYNGVRDVVVEFQDKYQEKIHTDYRHFKQGEVRNPYDKIICGVGYLGKGDYKSNGKDGKSTKCYVAWHNMIKRCYDPYELNKRMTYIDCYVCDEWLNFQNFAKWFYKNYYEIENQRMHLDKDILFKSNKIYSPDTCLIVPERINTLFVKRQNDRGEYPIGVCRYRNKKCKSDTLVVHCSIENKYKPIGYFPLNRPFQAFTCYKNFKENYIKQVAEEYKDLIPQKLYEALYLYKVEIND